MRGKEGTDRDRTWQWIAKRDLKGYTEALICNALEQALRTNYRKFHIDHTAESPLCGMCGSKGETVTHAVSECSELAQTEYCIKGGMITWNGISTGNFVVNVNWKERTTGMNRS